MKIKFIIITVISILSILAVLLFRSENKEKIYIAVAGPMNTYTGIEMLQGIDMCKENVNKQGGIHGKKIELIIFDDENDINKGKEIAAKIVNMNKALIVLGHYYSSVSNAVGKIYKRNEIPAITGSATARNVTFGNEWYFRTIPNNTIQSEYIANYIFHILKKDIISIVYTNDSYGMSLIEGFEKISNNIGLKINNRYKIDQNNSEMNDRLDEIVNKINENDDSQVIFIATHTKEGAKIITKLKQKGCYKLLFGSDSFSNNLLIKEIENFQSNLDINDILDNVFCVSPFMPDTAGKYANNFNKEFKKKFLKLPGWRSACYYDAMLMACEAIKNSNIKGKGYIRENRRNIQKALVKFYGRRNAVNGVGGYLFFDDNGDVDKPYSICLYQKGQLLPAYFQYQQITNINRKNLINDILDNKIYQISSKLMKKVKVVFTGIHIKDISEIDIINKKFKLNFELWFKYQGEFDDSNIEFINSINNIKLEKPVKEIIEGKTIYKIYNINDFFKIDTDFSYYPFDKHILSIKIKHRNETSDKIIYVPYSCDFKNSYINTLQKWFINKTEFFQDIIVNKSTLGITKYFNNPLDFTYSRLNTNIYIERKLKQRLLQKIYLIFAILIILISINYLSYNLKTKTLTLFTIFIFCTLGYQTDFTCVDMLTFNDVLFFILYVFIIISTIFIIIEYYYTKQVNTYESLYKIEKFIVYPIAAFITLYLYSKL